MRKRVRVSSVRGRVPARSRMTVRRSEAPLVRGSKLATALRSSREALLDLEGQLDALLTAVRGPHDQIDALLATSERVSGATGVADAALGRLGTLARRR
jgi:hypothetical protein